MNRCSILLENENFLSKINVKLIEKLIKFSEKSPHLKIGCESGNAENSFECIFNIVPIIYIVVINIDNIKTTQVQAKVMQCAANDNSLATFLWLITPDGQHLHHSFYRNADIAAHLIKCGYFPLSFNSESRLNSISQSWIKEHSSASRRLCIL